MGGKDRPAAERGATLVPEPPLPPLKNLNYDQEHNGESENFEMLPDSIYGVGDRNSVDLPLDSPELTRGTSAVEVISHHPCAVKSRPCAVRRTIVETSSSFPVRTWISILQRGMLDKLKPCGDD